MIEKYRYLRDNSGAPRITICLMMDGGNGRFGKGVAICSPKDSPCKNTGRKIARDRAIAAMYNKTMDGLPIQRDEAVDTVHDCTGTNVIFCMKKASQALTDYEKAYLLYEPAAHVPGRIILRKVRRVLKSLFLIGRGE
jgi:hypothetical protein